MDSRESATRGQSEQMNKLQRQTIDHLEALVGFDTRNPPRSIDEGGLFAYLRDNLSGFDFHSEDHGDGCISLLASRGSPDTVFNFHVDTVPAADGWRDDPLALRVTPDRAYGLGACDIKGAAACMLSAAAQGEGPLALLFTSDEEAGNSRCIRRFLGTSHGFKNAIVAEPTGAKAVLAHRGIATATIGFGGIAGHASAARALEDNAIHRAIRWGTRALEFAQQRQHREYEGLKGIPLNIGTIAGGVKPNVIAAEAVVRFGIRPLPDQDGRRLLEQLRQLAPDAHVAGWQEGFVGPALPGPGVDRERAAHQLAEHCALPTTDAVNFWTEASLFSAAGLAALVFGPGDIEQAHCANEWVALEQLDAVTQHYIRLIDHDNR